jgi:hypothetical protein
MQYTIFTVIRDIRGMSLSDLRRYLYDRFLGEMEEMEFGPGFGLHMTNGKVVQRQLARFTDWLECQSDQPGRYEDYIVRSGTKPFEVEHIWANHYERFTEQFAQKNDFDRNRNRIGALLLLPKKVNASLNDMTYEEKLPHYLKENALAKTLHPGAYENNPGFLQTISKHNLPFKPHLAFSVVDLEERSKVYSKLAANIWSAERLLAETETA